MQRFDKKKKTEKKLWNSKVLCSPKFPQQFTCFFTVYAEEKKKNESNIVRYAFPIIGSEKKPFKIIAINEEIQAKKASYQNKYVRMEVRWVS